MKKRSIFLLIVGLVLFIVPFFINSYKLWRLLILALGIIIITISLLIFNKKNVLLVILTPIFLLSLSYGIDMFLLYQFKHMPVYVYEIKSSDKMSTYNSLFYRIYKCNDELNLDYGYQQSYKCSINDLETIDINTLLADPVESYNKYSDKFIKVRGKISKISGVEIISLSAYEMTDTSLNGYVTFNQNYNLEIKTNEDLSKYRIYDYVEVIGRVENLEKDEGYTIYLKDTLLIPSDIYNNYIIEIKDNKDVKLTNMIEEQNYYYYGIDSFVVKYNEDNIYELGYLFNDTRFTWKDLINNTPAEFIKDKDKVIAYKYTLKKYNLLDCVNGRKVVASKNSKLTKDVCTMDLEAK